MKTVFLIFATIIIAITIWAIVKLLDLESNPDDEKFTLYTTVAIASFLLYLIAAFAIILIN